jgi:pimeloyl-ACP methyl ester carboxylesterase
MASCFENVSLRYDSAVAACKVPLLMLMAETSLSDVPRLREVCPQVKIGQTVGAGHFHQLEVPDQVNAMIERFLAVAVAK